MRSRGFSSRPGRNTSGSCARRSERTKGAHPDPAGFVADPEKFRLLRKLDRRDETILSLRRQLSAKDAYIARLEGMLGIVRRGGPDGRTDPKPLGESTPSSRILFKEKSSEEKQKRQGGAKPGHPRHGRRSVEPDKADRETLQSVMETLSLSHKDPSGSLPRRSRPISRGSDAA